MSLNFFIVRLCFRSKNNLKSDFEHVYTNLACFAQKSYKFESFSGKTALPYGSYFGNCYKLQYFVLMTIRDLRVS